MLERNGWGVSHEVIELDYQSSQKICTIVEMIAIHLHTGEKQWIDLDLTAQDFGHPVESQQQDLVPGFCSTRAFSKKQNKKTL